MSYAVRMAHGLTATLAGILLALGVASAWVPVETGYYMRAGEVKSLAFLMDLGMTADAAREEQQRCGEQFFPDPRRWPPEYEWIWLPREVPQPVYPDANEDGYYYRRTDWVLVVATHGLILLIGGCLIVGVRSRGRNTPVCVSSSGVTPRSLR